MIVALSNFIGNPSATDTCALTIYVYYNQYTYIVNGADLLACCAALVISVSPQAARSALIGRISSRLT
jgi:hypothetical protein